jgi:glycosyltransferase involved in cell wall biosynthesis
MEYPVSVVICSHNPQPAYLERVLDALKSQTLPSTEWELLLVDNASKEPLSTSFDISWHPNARHILEEQLGTVFARHRGLKESKGAISIFVDDDNVLDSNYLHFAIEISESHPLLGVWGGQVSADFQGGPPEEWTRPMWPLLAIGEFEKDSWSNLDQPETMPVGAGMCIRRKVAEKYIELVQADSRRLSLGQRGELLLRCEDFDIALASIDLGLGAGKFSGLKLVHIMPGSRLTEAYLTKLVKGIVYSRAVMDYLRDRPEEQLSWKRKIRYFVSSLWMNPRDRRFMNATKQAQAMAAKQIKAMREASGNTDFEPLVYQQIKI